MPGFEPVEYVGGGADATGFGVGKTAGKCSVERAETEPTGFPAAAG